MSVSSSTVQLARLARAIGMLRDVEWARRIAALRLPPGEFAARPEGLLAKRWGVVVPSSIGPAFLRGYFQLCELERRFAAGFALASDGASIVVTLGELRFRVRHYPDIDVLAEIFLASLYGFSHTRPVVVWDIGMNIGAASLAFALQPSVRKVYGYEPFGPTFDDAVHNFGLNPGFSAKIEPHNVGIARREAVMRLPYAEELKGVVGPDARHGTPDAGGRQEEVRMEAAASCLRRILEQHPKDALLLKMDCEGTELEILQSLEGASLIDRIDVVLMEWHGSEALAGIESLLGRHGFSLARNRQPHLDVGMLYAFRCDRGGPE